MRRSRLALALLATALTGAVLGAALLAVLANRFLGFQVLVVRSDSMVPALRPGDLVVIRPVGIQRVKTGDIVLFEEGEQVRLPVVHRVVSVVTVRINLTDSRTGKTTTAQRPLLRTQGDANPAPDGQVVDDSRFKGLVWFSIPRAGDLLTAGPVRLVFLGLAIVSLLGWATYELVGVRRRRASRPS